MTDSQQDAAARVRAAVPATREALEILSKEVPGGLNAPVNERVRRGDFSELEDWPYNAD